jgi:hypothetical protein
MLGCTLEGRGDHIKDRLELRREVGREAGWSHRKIDQPGVEASKGKERERRGERRTFLTDETDGSEIDHPVCRGEEAEERPVTRL